MVNRIITRKCSITWFNVSCVWYCTWRGPWIWKQFHKETWRSGTQWPKSTVPLKTNRNGSWGVKLVHEWTLRTRGRLNVTCFVFSERDDELVVVIDESGEGARLCVAHAHAPLLPGSRWFFFLQRHDSTARATGITCVVTTKQHECVVKLKAGIHGSSLNFILVRMRQKPLKKHVDHYGKYAENVLYNGIFLFSPFGFCTD